MHSKAAPTVYDEIYFWFERELCDNAGLIADFLTGPVGLNGQKVSLVCGGNDTYFAYR